jgi:hypothetical protein
VGSKAANCAGTESSGPGGFTYGDFGHVTNGPEVHADGEIWAQTLWDLRGVLGSRTTQSLVTRAMELSPSNPSFLDERNSILQADVVVNKGKNLTKIWQVFAKRGMGFFAGATDGDDAQPVEDFSMPPAAGTPRGTLTGTVTDVDTDTPVAGAVVGFGGHASGFAGDYVATTTADGRYSITGILPGTYPKVFVRAPGYDPASATVSVAARANTRDWAIRRDWAASSGGAAITAFNGVDFTADGCGPDRLIDQSQGAGWVSDAVSTGGAAVQPRYAVIRLPNAVSVSQIAINPTSSCGVGGSASTGDYSVETSTDGTTWTAAASGHFGLADRNRMNPVALAPGSTAGVRYVRYTMRGTQLVEAGGTCPGAFGACDYVSSTELAVYGTRS